MSLQTLIASSLQVQEMMQFVLVMHFSFARSKVVFLKPQLLAIDTTYYY